MNARLWTARKELLQPRGTRETVRIHSRCWWLVDGWRDIGTGRVLEIHPCVLGCENPTLVWLESYLWNRHHFFVLHIVLVMRDRQNSESFSCIHLTMVVSLHAGKDVPYCQIVCQFRPWTSGLSKRISGGQLSDSEKHNVEGHFWKNQSRNVWWISKRVEMSDESLKSLLANKQLT